MKRIIALLLCICMLMSLAACGVQPAQKESAQSQGNTEEMSREDKELVAQLIGNQDGSDLSDEELDQLIDELLEDTESSGNVVNLGNGGKTEQPSVNVSDNKEVYDENGAMTKPFDQVYPELIENEQVVFSGESILIKLASDKLTDGLKAAGIGALEQIVCMEGAAWYEAKLKEGIDARKALAAVRELDEVLLAEYNYEVQTAALDHYKDFDKDHQEKFDRNEHHKDQWHMHHCGIPDAFGKMETEGGSSSVVVAVIDSGVDYTHEDLKDNMWVNTREIPDNGCDDDGNGYIDDYYGVDIIARQGNGGDTNGHGTHVAGIIAAKNNNTGALGIAYNVKIMSVKAAMHNGTLNQADIARAVLYAYEMGAQVINMSFGGAACSIAVQDALETAYTRCVLVASAGNSGANNEPTPQLPLAIPNYPAALTYVLGVMSVDENGAESGFTNWDVIAFNGVEYELYAPGENIMSTLPGNQYGFLSGTSMAAPVVSAFAAILRSEFSDPDMYPTKFIYGQLAATSEIYADCAYPYKHGSHNIPQVVDLHAALTKLPKPQVKLQDYAIFDDPKYSDKNNGDGVIDAGETIALGLTLRNRWGMSENTLVTIDTKSGITGLEDPYFTIKNPTVDYGSVGTYSTQDAGKIYTDALLTGWEKPFLIEVAPNCPNDYRFTLNVTIRCENALDEEDTTVYTTTGQVNENVRAGFILPSVIEEDMVLTPDNLYIIPNATVIKENVTVRVMPGTHIQFWSDDANDPYAMKYIASLYVEGRFLVEGTKEAPVYIYPSELMSDYNVDIQNENEGYVSLKYADVTNFASGEIRNYYAINVAERCTFRINYTDRWNGRRLDAGVVNDYVLYSPYMYIGVMKDCVFYRLDNAYGVELKGDVAERCIFVQCGLGIDGVHTKKDCVFLGNRGDYHSLSATIQRSDLYVAENLEIYYRKENNTTYILANTGSWYADQNLADLIQAIYGGNYAKIETEEEQKSISSLCGGRAVRMGIRRNDNGEFLWYDGTPVASFLLQDPLIKASKLPHINTLYNNYIVNNKSGSYCLYEIQGQLLPEDITFREYTADIDMGTTYQIVPKSTPVQLGVDQFLYESTDKTVLTVSETGLVTPVGPGTADVWVWSADKAIRNRVTIRVGDYVALEKLELALGSKEVAVGGCLELESILTPANTTRRNVCFTSSDASVATINNGVVTGISSGLVTITATCEGLSACVEVKVYNQATELEIKQQAVVMSMEQQPVLPEVIVSDGAEPKIQWTSSDEGVLQIVNNVPVLHKEGATCLTATDLRSGLSDTVQVYVVETALSQIKDIQQDDGSRIYLLMEDGSLYQLHGRDCVRLFSDVKDFSAQYWGMLLLMRDGSLKLYKQGEVRTLTANGIEGEVEEIGAEIPKSYADDEDCYWVKTVSGDVYYFRYGQTTATKVQFNEPVAEMIDGTYKAFLAESGNLYYAQFGDQTATLVARNVTYATVEENAIYYISGGYGYNFYIGSDTYYESGIDYSGYDRVYIRDYVSTFDAEYQSALVIKDGKLAVLTGGNGYLQVSKEIPIDGEIGCIFGSSLNKLGSVGNGAKALIATTDGLLYGIGELDYFGAYTVVDQNFPALIYIPRFEEMLQVTGSNLSADNVLSENALEITFNKTLEGVSAKLYENGIVIASDVVRTDNKIAVSTHLDFAEGVPYTLVISAADTKSLGGMSLAEDVSISFTYERKAQIEEDDSVVYEAILDESVERVLTNKTLAAKLNEYIDQTQHNASFNGNAILNPIATNIKVENWFRPIATADSGAEIAFGGNWWGTVNEEAIRIQMIDYTDFISYARLMYAPYLTEAPENTFPFVTSVKLFNKDGEEVTTVGNETVTFRITFNRDMDVSIPLQVRFGSAYPYGDYEFEGEYVDARTWEGTYTLNTLIENGYQYFTIANGCSATDDLELQTDRGRFSFEIDTTAAQALIMQGTATDTGIQLKWTQDDFDTLMGYNVYRSDAEDGYYQRLNTTVIPADTMEFFDDTVEPGKVYYYNFTVVQTDMAESEPSGKIVIMSKDTMAPNIYHSPVANAFTGANLVVDATITDNLNIAYANLYYRVVGTDSWKTVRMNKLNDKYSAIIPAQYVTVDGIEYYIEAFDGVSYTYKGSAETPYTILVQEAVDANSLGDVDGDGVITNLDALILLYAINDKYNLSAEEFARADLNGDGVLWAAEALRILQYVSGVVGSVKM